MSEISGFTGTIVLGDLVSENIIIPYYQRPYVWDRERTIRRGEISEIR